VLKFNIQIPANIKKACTDIDIDGSNEKEFQASWYRKSILVYGILYIILNDPHLLTATRMFSIEKIRILP
jgi:hypothetical protein